MTKPFDPAKPVQTRKGWPARIVATDIKGKDPYPILALVTHPEGYEEIETYTTNGCYNAKNFDQNIMDLVNVPERETVWVNVYRDGVGGLRLTPHTTKGQASGASLVHYGTLISRMKLEIEEGRFDA